MLSTKKKALFLKELGPNFWVILRNFLIRINKKVIRILWVKIYLFFKDPLFM